MCSQIRVKERANIHGWDKEVGLSLFSNSYVCMKIFASPETWKHKKWYMAIGALQRRHLFFLSLSVAGLLRTCFTNLVTSHPSYDSLGIRITVFVADLTNSRLSGLSTVQDRTNLRGALSPVPLRFQVRVYN